MRGPKVLVSVVSSMVVVLGLVAFGQAVAQEAAEEVVVAPESEAAGPAAAVEPLPDPDPEELPPTAVDGVPEPSVLSCTATESCDNCSSVSCSCTSGTCSNNPYDPWGGSVTCNCGGGPVTYYCPVPSCKKKSCDLQCGGPGYGRCICNTCYCL